jgi:flagella basal body P-ring formation protein FlgA
MRRTGALGWRNSSPLRSAAPLKFQPVKDYLPTSLASVPAAALRAAGLALWIGNAAASAPAPAAPAAPVATDAAAAAPAWFSQVEPLATQATRAAFAGRPGLRVEVIPGSLDPRLNLAPCSKVQPYLPAGHRAWGRTRIGLRCVEGPVAWNVTMPLTVKVFAPALVARQPLSAGTALGPEHVEEAEAEWTASDSPVFTDIQGVLGRALTRPLTPGQAVRESDLRKRQWFAAGDPVRLLVSGSGFSITGEGTALTPGLEGQLVRVRTEGGRVVSGRAKGERMVEVDL